MHRSENTSSPSKGPLDPLISPDATKLAYVVKGQLWIRDLDRLSAAHYSRR